ncbi:MAG: hypothetical protein ACWGN7_05175, partial [Thermodesulfovibrionales bacterium]
MSAGLFNSESSLAGRPWELRFSSHGMKSAYQFENNGREGRAMATTYVSSDGIIRPRETAKTEDQSTDL